jgi:hypothetical protein
VSNKLRSETPDSAGCLDDGGWDVVIGQFVGGKSPRLPIRISGIGKSVPRLERTKVIALSLLAQLFRQYRADRTTPIAAKGQGAATSSGEPRQPFSTEGSGKGADGQYRRFTSRSVVPCRASSE